MSWEQAAIQAGGQVVQGVTGSVGVKRQYKYNKKLAAFQHKQNMELLKYQLDYNSPASQMARFEAAGLNKNLIYGQGDAGNMQSAPRYPDIAPPDVQSIYADVFERFQRGRLLAEQADLTRTKVDESGVKQDLMKAQKQLVRANPYLNADYMSSLVNNLAYTASVKESQSILANYQAKYIRPGSDMPIGFEKIERELELMEQKFNLGTQDQKIKAQIIESKEFQNELLRIQKDWMKDGDITPQHIYQFIMMLMTKMASR